MDTLIGFAMLLVISALVAIVTAYTIGKAPEAIAGIFGRDTGPSWPRGVQEDDAPPRWKLNGPGD